MPIRGDGHVFIELIGHSDGETHEYRPNVGIGSPSGSPSYAFSKDSRGEWKMVRFEGEPPREYTYPYPNVDYNPVVSPPSDSPTYEPPTN